MDAKKWRRELADAKRREKDWSDKAKKLIALYRGDQRKRNSFNIFYSNTDILAPSLLNSTPTPDVRRRFRDEDPLGKAVSTVMERALSVVLDQDESERSWKDDVLDACVIGRGLSRVRYVPQLVTEDATEPDEGEEAEPPVQRLQDEKVCIEHVHWEDYRQGYGRTWDEVQWVAFRHKLRKPEVAEKFGDDVAEQLTYSAQSDEEEKREDQADDTKYAELWEVWSKTDEKVCFVSEAKELVLYPLDTPDGEPPIAFERFFPIPEPLRLFSDANSQVPTPLYQLYEEQAEELNRLSVRINRIVGQMKVRGIYPGMLGEIASMLEGDDGTLQPIENAQAWAAAGGGLDRAISWMPVEQLAVVLIRLYEAREACKQTIYEISGLSDILRGATKASETLGAQQIKANFAMIRLSRMKDEVARYVRDSLRLVAEVIGEKMSPQTLAVMTGLRFPTAEEKAMLAAQGQQVPVPSWDEIMSVLANDKLRGYRVDVETDSTVAASIESDMTGIRDVLTGIVQLVQGLGPAVQAGAMPVEAVKELILAVTRRSKMGLAVEDALEKVQAPQPQQEPGAEQAQQAQQMEQMRAQAEQQAEAARMQLEQARAQADMAIAQAKAQAEIDIMRARAEAEMQLAREKMAMEMELERLKIEANRAAL